MPAYNNAKEMVGELKSLIDGYKSEIEEKIFSFNGNEYEKMLESNPINKTNLGKIQDSEIDLLRQFVSTFDGQLEEIRLLVEDIYLQEQEMKMHQSQLTAAREQEPTA